ncbi:bifunctional (p)ppGpp synthetase/guanosine-3',5'-bis(diphosphate) 3'-pyrophosphohydrolase [archaeon]|nr:bifunctional (p)ppGpp synthetase/guanosine-3',5'-bis(diphosphate) 3'-pyrophosphohydrolase [archaeon]
MEDLFEIDKEKKDFFREAIDFLEKYKEFFDRDLNIKVGNYLILEDHSKEQIYAGFFQNPKEEIKEEIRKKFGKEVLKILEEQKKLKEIIKKSNKENSEILRKVIISSIENIEGIEIETISKFIVLCEKKEKNLAKEMNEFYAPLLGRLGLENIRKKILNESFKILNPKKYLEISNFLKMSKNEREEFIKKIIKEFEIRLKKELKGIKIKGREKQIYSIYEKITKRKVPLNEQKDQFAIRIITPNIKDCYSVFEIISQDYEVLEETIKDYIKNQKENGYQSLHFCILFEKKLLEIQIRTKEMDEFAEEGKAAHWAYKKIKGDKKFEKKTGWFKELLKLKENKNSLINELKINIFQDKIYCYTPKGKVIELKNGSTVLDFAYKIHAEIGNQSIGGVVDGKFVPLKTILKNNQTIEITTNKFQRPRRDWMKFVKTSYAKKIISREVKRFENIPVPRSKPLENSKENKTENPVIMKEFKNHLLTFAKCCNPLPGEKIIGIIKSHKRGLIHKKGCNRIKEAKKNQVEASWKETFEKQIKLTVEGRDRPGILADILNTISRKGFKVVEANAKLAGNENTECYFILKLNSLEELEEIIERVKKIEGIKKIWLD